MSELSSTVQDIFYHIKRQMLDKLDIILQKANLAIIEHLNPKPIHFKFIQLASFQTEITNLFEYLDKLYDDLNSSIPFSDNSMSNTLKMENIKLTDQNSKLKQIVDTLQQNNNININQQHSIDNWQKSLCKQCLALYTRKQQSLKYNTYKGTNSKQSKQFVIQLCQQLSTLSLEYNNFNKEIRKILKQFKFTLLQLRIEIISYLRNKIPQTSQNIDTNNILSNKNHNCNKKNHKDIIINKINQLLQLC